MVAFFGRYGLGINHHVSSGREDPKPAIERIRDAEFLLVDYASLIHPTALFCRFALGAFAFGFFLEADGHRFVTVGAELSFNGFFHGKYGIMKFPFC
jgi:hypothetical protein